MKGIGPLKGTMAVQCINLHRFSSDPIIWTDF